MRLHMALYKPVVAGCGWDLVGTSGKELKRLTSG